METVKLPLAETDSPWAAALGLRFVYTAHLCWFNAINLPMLGPLRPVEICLMP